jgi:hypothetical protein
LQLINEHALVVDRHALQSHTTGLEGQPGRRVSGILDCNPIGAIKQELGQEVESLLRAADDHDLVRDAINSAKARNVIRNGLAELTVPLRRRE